MEDVLVIGAGPAGLLAAWVAHQTRRKGTRTGERHRHDAHFAGMDPRF